MTCRFIMMIRIGNNKVYERESDQELIDNYRPTLSHRRKLEKKPTNNNKKQRHKMIWNFSYSKEITMSLILNQDSKSRSITIIE